MTHTLTLISTRWWEQAACADPLVEPGLFDIDPGHLNQATKDRMFDAAEICSSCPVVDACLNAGKREHAVDVIRAGRVFTGGRGTPPTVAEYLTAKDRPRTTMPPRVCEVCDQSYYPTNSQQRYCSRKCKFHADWKRRATGTQSMTARTCDSPECVRRFDATNPRQRFCSQSCRETSKRRRAS